MSVAYSAQEIDARLNGTVQAIDANGTANLIVRQGATALSTIQLSNPCGTVSGGVLTFTGQLVDPSAAATGFADNAVILDGAGNTVVSGLTVGASSVGYDLSISNGAGTTLISAGQAIQLLSATITGA